VESGHRHVTNSRTAPHSFASARPRPTLALDIRAKMSTGNYAALEVVLDGIRAENAGATEVADLEAIRGYVSELPGGISGSQRDSTWASAALVRGTWRGSVIGASPGSATCFIRGRVSIPSPPCCLLRSLVVDHQLCTRVARRYEKHSLPL
jgi:hypothetical protein